MIVERMVRVAADRWVAAGRPDPYREWAAELAALRGSRGSRLHRLGFAASLLVSRAPRPGERPAPAGVARSVGIVAVLLLVPSVGTSLIQSARYLPSMFVVADPKNPDNFLTAPAIGAMVAATFAVLLLLAYLGRGIGRRLPLCTAAGRSYRLAVTATVTPLLLGAGTLLDTRGLGALDTLGAPPGTIIDLSAPLGMTVVGVALWAVLVGAVGIAVRRLPRRRRWRRPVYLVLGGLLATDLAVTVTALPSMARLPGALRSLPLWFPALVADPIGTARLPLGPAHGDFTMSEWLDGAVGGLSSALLASAAFGLAYLVAAARPVPAVARAAQVPARPQKRSWRSPGWVFVALGGLAWVVSSAYLPTLAWNPNGDYYGDGSMITEETEIRRGALVLCCCGLIVALRRMGPVLPALVAGIALTAANVGLSRWAGPPAGTAAVATAALLVVVAGAALGSRLAVRTGRRYGRWSLPAVAIIAACCAPALPNQAEVVSDTPAVWAFAILAAAIGGGLALLSGYCVVREVPVGRAMRVVLLGIIPSAPAILALASAVFVPAGLAGMLVVVTIAVTLATLNRRRFSRVSRVAIGVLALFGAVPMVTLMVLPSMLLAEMLPETPDGAGADGAPMVAGAMLVGVVLALAHIGLFNRPAPGETAGARSRRDPSGAGAPVRA